MTEHQKIARNLTSEVEVSDDEDNRQRQEGHTKEEEGHGRSPWRVALETFYCLKNTNGGAEEKNEHSSRGFQGRTSAETDL